QHRHHAAQGVPSRTRSSTGNATRNGGEAVVHVHDLEVRLVLASGSGRRVGRVVRLTGGVVLAPDAAGAVVEEVLAAAAGVAGADDVACVVVLVAPRVPAFGGDAGWVKHTFGTDEAVRDVRLGIEHHVADAVVTHPAH